MFVSAAGFDTAVLLSCGYYLNSLGDVCTHSISCEFEAIYLARETDSKVQGAGSGRFAYED